MADESDDRTDEREVLTNLPRTRPARRSTRRASTTPPAEPAPAKRAPAKRRPAKRAPAKPKAVATAAPAEPVVAEAVVVPPREPRPSLMADLAVTGIELTGAMFQLGISITRSVLGATLGRIPRP